MIPEPIYTFRGFQISPSRGAVPLFNYKKNPEDEFESTVVLTKEQITPENVTEESLARYYAEYDQAQEEYRALLEREKPIMAFNLKKYKLAQKNAMQRKAQPSNWYRQAAEWGDFSNEDEKLNRRYTPGIDPNDYIVEGTPVCNVSLGDEVTDGRGHFFKVEKISLNEENECESMATIRPYRNIDVETGKLVDPDTHTLYRAVQDIRMITQTDIENVLDVMKRIKQTRRFKPNFNRLKDTLMPKKQTVPVRF